MNDVEIYKSFLNKLHTKEWTMAEFDKEIAYWFIHCVYDPHPEPERPKELLEYDVLTTKEKSSLPGRFWHSMPVSAYMNKRDRAYSYNKGILDGLKRFKAYIPEKDDHTHRLYQNKIDLFSVQIPNGVEKIREMFGGSVEKV